MEHNDSRVIVQGENVEELAKQLRKKMDRSKFHFNQKLDKI